MWSWLSQHHHDHHGLSASMCVVSVRVDALLGVRICRGAGCVVPIHVVPIHPVEDRGDSRRAGALSPAPSRTLHDPAASPAGANPGVPSRYRPYDTGGKSSPASMPARSQRSPNRSRRGPVALGQPVRLSAVAGRDASGEWRFGPIGDLGDRTRWDGTECRRLSYPPRYIRPAGRGTLCTITAFGCTGVE